MIVEYIIAVVFYFIAGIVATLCCAESDYTGKVWLFALAVMFLGGALIINGKRDRDMKKEWSTDIEAVNYTVDTVVNVSKNDTTYILNFKEK